MTPEDERRRELVYERAMADIREIIDTIRPCDLAMSAIYRRLGKALMDAWPLPPPPKR